jgi:hypothetical protein
LSIRDFLASQKRKLVSRLVHPDIERIEIKLNEILARPIATIIESAPDAQIRMVEKFAVQSFWAALDRIYDRDLEARTLKCIVCDHADKRAGFEVKTTECIFGGGKLERYVCPSCDCIFGAQKFLDLSPSLVDLDYRLLYSRYREGNTTENEVRTFRSLKPRKGKVYLNWGAGAWNTTVGDMRTDGFDVWGYEPSAETSSQFVVSEKRAIVPLDGLFSNNVIEHFLDPVGQFKEFHSMMKPSALMAHSTACYEYRYEFSRFHTIFLLGRSVEILAKRTGFKLVDSTVDGEYMNRVFRRV